MSEDKVYLDLAWSLDRSSIWNKPQDLLALRNDGPVHGGEEVVILHTEYLLSDLNGPVLDQASFWSTLTFLAGTN